MTGESAFIDSLRALATHPAARGLLDDAAVLALGDLSLVLTTDMLAEGVHYLPGDPPEDVAWKLVAVNLSDLAAKGAQPLGALLGFTLGPEEWDRAFANGLKQALGSFHLSLLGGDTIALPAGAPRVLALTLIGQARGVAPARSGARPGDRLWVSGSIGDAGAGLAALRGEASADPSLVARYRRPRPRLEAGAALAPVVHAMMDVSDGLLLDASRMAAASACGITIDLDAIPLSDAFLTLHGDGREARLRAATAGDDYELLFAAPTAQSPELLAVSERLGLSLTPIGIAEEGAGLVLRDGGGAVPLPPSLGFAHRSR